ncbi:CDP-glucose 4,6-dehydratase [Rhodopseudomonas palustris]|uniref:CDP-glucose 4,6-dehydratase n=1 Tax=Rhodopseudomonas palustris TaxID=1076 RepID=UPI001AED71F4|nr:CDP-glucose 4,6-dehydratase [Rhodopseudomonas palustris]
MSTYRNLAGLDILVTGHTGFTGTWACHWLHRLGARVHGLALSPTTKPNLFDATDAEAILVSHTIGDIGDLDTVLACVEACRPKLILHLAAQPLVLASYSHPVETYRTNVLGTVHVLEAARRNDCVAGVLCITTDKVYENRNWIHPYRENDRIGGADPYSASKSAAEIAIASYRASLPSWGRAMAIECARGGNIIGGGDWSENRLVPDYVRAAIADTPLEVRNPSATRPWQHVLCLVDGYLALLDRMTSGKSGSGEAWNLGPDVADCVPVRTLLDTLASEWKAANIVYGKAVQHEAELLVLDSTKARQRLDWRPRWALAETLRATAEWYREFYADPKIASKITMEQIGRYCGA